MTKVINVLGHVTIGCVRTKSHMKSRKLKETAYKGFWGKICEFDQVMR